VVRIREILSEFRLSWYGNHDLLMALAQCPDQSGLAFLTEIAGGLDDSAFQQIAKYWLEAVASCPLPGASDIMLSFVDCDVRTSVGNRALPDYAIDFLAARLCDLARTDPSVAQRIIQLTAVPVSEQQRTIIAKVIASLNSTAALVSGLNLINDDLISRIPYDIYQAIEDVVLEKRPHGPQSYTLAPRGASEIKARLFEMAKHDPQRAKSAHSLLHQIEEWRLEYGRPLSEPRHPDYDSREMWPPIC
jgi:hypothetical protein